MPALSFAQLQDLWVRNGGNPASAPVMASIALAESGGRTDAWNHTPPDNSVGVWQVNYYGPLLGSRTARYGTPEQMISDPDRQAKAAIDISGNGRNLNPWTTYTSGAYKRFLGSLPPIPATPPLPGLASPVGPAAAGSADEGFLFDIGLPLVGRNLQMRRSTARKMVGGAVLGAGALVGLAGLFLLAGKASSLGGAATAVRGLALPGGSGGPSLASLPGRRAQSAQVSDIRAYRSARAEGEKAAEAAGAF